MTITKTIKIRQATIEDIPRLVSMRWEHINLYAEYQQRPAVAYQDFEKACTTFLHTGITTGRWIVFVAIVDTVIVGHAYVQVVEKIPKPYELYGSWGYVSNMYVQEPHRNQGTGTLLLDALKTWACDVQLELLLLWPSEKSVNFYERNGFTAKTTCMQYTIKGD